MIKGHPDELIAIDGRGDIYVDGQVRRDAMTRQEREALATKMIMRWQRFRDQELTPATRVRE